MKIKLLFVGSVASLAILYILFLFYRPVEAESNYGKIVYFQGVVERIYFHKNGHVFLTLRNESKEMKVAIFSRVATKIAKEISMIEVGDIIWVKGRLSSYKGKPEIIVRKPEDIRWLS